MARSESSALKVFLAVIAGVAAACALGPFKNFQFNGIGFNLVFLAVASLPLIWWKRKVSISYVLAMLLVGYVAGIIAYLSVRLANLADLNWIDAILVLPVFSLSPLQAALQFGIFLVGVHLSKRVQRERST